jgi:short-subunit dehydrogenase
LITGASSGIGAALARVLAAQGVEVVISARREAELRALEATISAAGGRSHVAVLDLSDPRSAESRVLALDEEFQFDLVIASAGVGRFVSAQEMTWDACEEMISVNIAGLVATVSGALPGMLARGRGQVVGISSVGQGLAMPRNGVYLATKAFSSTFLASLRADVQAAGISVSDVRPGIVDTPMTQALKHRPFLIDANTAATTIVAGIRRRDPVIAFPRSAQIMVTAFRMMPNRVFSSVVRWIDKG